MFKCDEMDELFRYLLSDVGSAAGGCKSAADQSLQLLTAFNRIADPKLRRELVLLIEIVSQMPEAAQRSRLRLRPAKPARIH